MMADYDECVKRLCGHGDNNTTRMMMTVMLPLPGMLPPSMIAVDADDDDDDSDNKDDAKYDDDDGCNDGDDSH